MEAIQNTLPETDGTPAGSPHANPVPQVTQHEQERGKSQVACKSNSDGPEPRTGDYIMEPRIPEESASSLNFNSHQQNKSAVDTHHQIYPEASNIQQQQCQYTENPKRRRMTSSREELNDKAQQFIDEINEKRKADTVMLADFKKAMEMQVARSCGLLEQSMYQMYDQNGKIMQTKLQELFATLDRVAKLEVELQQFKSALGALYSDVQNPS